MSFYGPNIRRCQHIKVNGIQCGSPALKRNRFCFFHKRWHEQRIVINSARARKTRATLDLPVLEDANSIQVALMQVMGLLLRGQLDTKTAGMLLYGLQTASCNLRHTSFEHMIKTRFVIDPSRVGETELGADPWSQPDFYEEEDEEAEAPQAVAGTDKEEDELVEIISAASERKPAMKNPPSKEAIRAEIRQAVIRILPEAKRAIEDAASSCSVATSAPSAKPVSPEVAKTPSVAKQEAVVAENLSLIAAVMKNAANARKSPTREEFFSLPRDRERDSFFVPNGTERDWR